MFGALGLDDQMQVIRLDREVHETETPAFTGAPEARFHLPHEAHAAERRDVTPDANRDVAGMVR